MKKILAAAILAATATSAAFAAEYFVVVPVPNKAPADGNIVLTLSGYSMPAGVVGRAYPGFDFNSALQVLGDPSYSPSDVRWSVAGGALPAGLSLGADGKLTGTPTVAGTSSFQVMASYKTKAGEQGYQITAIELTTKLAASPAALNFGTVATNSSSTQTVTLQNNGDAATTSISYSLPAAVTETDNCGSALSAGASCTVTLKYAPTAAGTLAGNVVASAQDSSTAIALSGAAVTEGITVVSATYGANCGVTANNELAAAQALCNGKASCSSTPWLLNNSVDPARGCAKTFTATYTCSGQTGTKSISIPAEAQNGAVSMTCP